MSREGRGKYKKSVYEIVVALFRALPVRSLKTKTQLALEIHSRASTVEDYLELIDYIQKQPRIEKVPVGHKRYGWRRAQAPRESS